MRTARVNPAATLPEHAEPLRLDAEGDVELAAVVEYVPTPRQMQVAELQIAAERGATRNPAAAIRIALCRSPGAPRRGSHTG